MPASGARPVRLLLRLLAGGGGEYQRNPSDTADGCNIRRECHSCRSKKPTVSDLLTPDLLLRCCGEGDEGVTAAGKVAGRGSEN